MARFAIARLFSLAPRLTAPLLPVARPRLTVPNPSHRAPLYSPRLLSSSSPPPTPTALPANASLSQKLKHLIKSYGWYALGVYIVLSTLDFGVAFVGVNLLGAEYVSHAVATVKATVMDALHSTPAEPGLDEMEPARAVGQAGQEGLYAMLVLAYGIHKTLFLPVRVGLTAAFTPKLVQWLTRRGWVGGDGARRAAQEVRERLRERRNRD
ncbi:hypothetical protein MD484_g7163, partial [Candolleomyces efflorescens]